MDKEAQIRAAYSDLQTTVQGINANLSTTKQNAELSKMQYLQDQAKTDAASGANLSQSFIQTGVPQTAADFIYKTQNPTGFASKVGDNIGVNQGKQDILDAIKALSDGDVSSVVGWGNLNPLNKLPGAAGQAEKAKYDRLIGLLSLDNVSKLKGQGQVSDAERKLLADAASNLTQGQSADQITAELNRLYTGLSGGTGMAASGGAQSSGEINVRQKATGIMGTIPAAEFDPNLYDKI